MNDIKFELFMVFLNLFSICLVLIEIISKDDDLVDKLNNIDQVFLAFYCLEAVIKIFVLGIYGYFSEMSN